MKANTRRVVVFVYLLIAIFICNISNADYTIWGGPKKVFTKANYADWTQEQNQDRITDNVWLTRRNSEGLFNIKVESYFISSSPLNTKWAYGTVNDICNLDFKTWVDWHDWCPPCSVGQDAVLYLVTDNIYLEIKFLSWTSGGQGGGFSYERTDPEVFLRIFGNRVVWVKTGTSFSDPGATATNINNDTVQVTVTGAVDVNTPGTYILTYTANDTITGYSAVGQRKVIVSDNPPTIWNGPKITFTKADYADWTQEQNQDRITDNVWLTRQNSQGLFNIKVESYFDNYSPLDTEWAYGTLDEIGNLTFEYWGGWHGWCPPCSVGRDAVLHLITDNIYIQIKFLSWTSGAQGGGFSYERTTPPPSQQNNPPTLTTVNTFYSASEDTPFTITYNMLADAADEADLDNDPISFRIQSVLNGILTKNGNSIVPGVTLLSAGESVEWTPPQNQSGLIDAFTVVAWDGQDASASPVVVKINTLAVNDPPVANGQNVTTPEDASVNITLTGSDIEGDQLTFTVVTQPTNGTLSGTAPNLIYTPNANYNGTDAFTFKVNDGAADSDVATVNITITPVNDAPVVSGQSVVTFEDTPVNIHLIASDVDGNTLTYIIVKQPSYGTLGGTYPNLIYTPSANYYGSDNFTFKVNDGTVDSGIATVNITVVSVNDPPSFDIKHSSIVVNEDSPQTNITGFAYNISKGADNEKSQPIMFKVEVDNSSLFSIPPTIRLNGTLSFKPAPNANGRATVTAYLIDGGGTANGGNDISAPKVFTIDIVNVNDPPVLKPLDRYFINRTEYEDTYQEGGYKYNFGVTDLETLPQNLILTVTSTNQSLIPNGNIQISANGTNRIVTVTPIANAFGTTLLTFTLSDGTNTVTKTSVLRVVAVNDAPYFELLSDTIRCLANVGRYTGNIINMSTLSVGPQNESSQSWTFQVVSNTDPTAFSTQPVINKYGVLTFTPKRGFIGNVTIGIKMVDSGNVSYGGQNSYGPVELTIQIYDY